MGGSGVAAWVVMYENRCGAGTANQRPKCLTWMYQAGVECADGDDVLTDYVIFGGSVLRREIAQPEGTQDRSVPSCKRPGDYVL